MLNITTIEETTNEATAVVAQAAPVETKVQSAEKEAGFAAITVQSGIPLPTTASRSGKYPWDKMATGDSFFVPGAKVETFYTLTSTASKKYKCRFIARKWHEGTTEGVRVWRTEA